MSAPVQIAPPSAGYADRPVAWPDDRGGRGQVRRGDRRPQRPPVRMPRLIGDDADQPLLRAAAQLATLLAEVEAGRRSLNGLRTLICPRLVAQIAPAWRRPDRSPRSLRSVMGRRLARDRFVAVAVLTDGRRCGAVHLELTRRRGRWVADVAIRPEDPPLPEPPWTLPPDHHDTAVDLPGALAG